MGTGAQVTCREVFLRMGNAGQPGWLDVADSIDCDRAAGVEATS